jgi:hypothetical protein
MKESATIKFTELESSDEALVIVRYDESSVALGLSIMSDGDMEVFMTKETARAVIKALQAAVM